MKIEIKNLTKEQEIAISDLLYEWVRLGQMGSSRWTAFYADGDGNFHPKITIDSIPPMLSQNLVNHKDQWRDFEFKNNVGYAGKGLFIDFDGYGCILREKLEQIKDKAIEVRGTAINTTGEIVSIVAGTATDIATTTKEVTDIVVDFIKDDYEQTKFDVQDWIEGKH